MYIYESFDPSPFRVHAYRTKEALFLHIIPMSWETCLRQIRLFLITFGSPFLFMIFVALYQGRFADAAGLLFFGIVCQCLLVLCAYLLTCEESLICIDRNTIHKTTWFFGIGSRATLTRPDKITFQRCDGKWCIVTINGNIPFVIRLNIRNHELQWIREIIEQFENEVPVLLPETDSQPVSVSENTEIKNGRRILKNKEYRGQQLRKIPNPAEKHYVNNITKNKLQDELAGTLQVRCPHCHSILPTDFIHADIAAAQCPSCGFLFQVADLKRCPPPRRSSIKLRTEENVLKLHQYPQFFDLPLIYHCLFLVIVHIDLLFVAFCIYIRSINPAATLQEIMETVPKAESMLLVFVLINLFCFLLFLWSIFVHRFVEFRPNNVYFRIRWLCFWRSWTVPRSRLGASRLTFFSHILNLGFQIPYGKKSFPIGAKYFEIPWIVGEINHWLFTHPPEEDFVSDNFPKFENTSLDSFSEAPNNLVIGGVTEMNDKEIRWRCCDCGHLFLTEELYFPNRNAFCPNCRETFDLSQLRYYAAERIAIKPELPQLSVTESEKEQQIEFSATPINVFEKEMYFTCFIMCGIFLSFVLLSWITKISAILILIILQQLDFTVLLPMVVEAINPSIVPLVIFIFLFLLYDNYRQKFTAWTTRFSDDYFELTRRYKNHSETIRIEINRIVRFQCGRVAKNFDGSMKNLKNRFFGRFPANLEGRGQNRNEMVLTDGTIFYLPVLPTSKKCYGNNNWLVNTWNEQLYQNR